MYLYSNIHTEDERSNTAISRIQGPPSSIVSDSRLVSIIHEQRPKNYQTSGAVASHGQWIDSRSAQRNENCMVSNDLAETNVGDWPGKTNDSSSAEAKIRPRDLSRERSRPEHGSSGSDNETEKVSIGEDQSPWLDNDWRLILAYEKHQLIVKLMREVYTMFGQSWAANVQTHAESGSDSSSFPIQKEHSEQNSSQSNGKRHMNKGDLRPPNDDHDKRKKRILTPPGLINEGRLFACPFRKFDAYKYSCNVTTGAKYRTCVGPGFMSIARLK